MDKETLTVVYEDNHIIVVVKPQNIPTQEDESKDLDMLSMVKDYIKVKEKLTWCSLFHQLSIYVFSGRSGYDHQCR